MSSVRFTFPCLIYRFPCLSKRCVRLVCLPFPLSIFPGVVVVYLSPHPLNNSLRLMTSCNDCVMVSAARHLKGSVHKGALVAPPKLLTFVAKCIYNIYLKNAGTTNKVNGIGEWFSYFLLVHTQIYTVHTQR